jgi:hypothetical protein
LCFRLLTNDDLTKLWDSAQRHSLNTRLHDVKRHVRAGLRPVLLYATTETRPDLLEIRERATRRQRSQRIDDAVRSLPLDEKVDQLIGADGLDVFADVGREF